jgi:acetyltransferase
MSLDTFFNPAGVAVIGSAGEGKIANVLLHRLTAGGKEQVYAVNPKAQGVGPVKGYPSVAKIGRQVDLAVIAAPPGTVASVLEDCGTAGVQSAVIITSGFSEAGNAQGEEEIRGIARRHGIRFIGPNCAGLVNTHGRLTATLELCPKPGRIALVSQSGAVGGLFMSLAASHQTGVSKFVSYGNGADVNENELLAYLREDRETEVIALYLESIRDGRAFMDTLKSVTQVKPVVVIKSGRTSSGQRAAMSHTGSMAGSDKIFAAALIQSGALRAETLEELFDLTRGFASTAGSGAAPENAGPGLEGNRLAIVTNSGGPGVMTADRGDDLGLRVAEPPGPVEKVLASFLPPHAGIHNPVDLTVEGTGEEYEKVLTAMLCSYDSAVALYVGTPYLKSLPIAEGIIGGAKKSNKPVFAVFDVGSDLSESLARLEAAGIPNYPSGERAAAALNGLSRYNTLRTKLRREEERPVRPRGYAGEVSGEAAGHAGENGADGYPLPEPEGMSLLNLQGIPSPKFGTAASAEEAVQVCGRIGYPGVMKIISPRIIHKSDAGGVILNIKNAGESKTAFAQLAEIGKGKDFKGVIIYPMIEVDREVILGLTRDTNFGPVVAFGLGGIYTEVFKDLVFRIAPISEGEAEEMIREIKSFKILEGSRGKGPIDINRLAKIISDFSRMPFQYPEIIEADINPLAVSPDRIYALDARISVCPQSRLLCGQTADFSPMHFLANEPSVRRLRKCLF